jgi:excisionase family DNA binding protein
MQDGSDYLLTITDVIKRLHISRGTVYALTSRGAMPKPIKLGSSIRWRESDIAAFIAAGCSMPECAGVTLAH